MRLVKRAWGHYLVLLDRKQFKVKLLRFKKGSKLSEQYHRQRNELWLFLKSGEWILHPVLKQHTFYAEKVTWILEIQYGHICQESDIVRL